MNLEEMLSIARQQGFTDVHVSPDFPLIGRKNGKLTVLEASPVSEDSIRKIADSIMSEAEKLKFFAQDPCVFMYETPEHERFRVSAYFTGKKPVLSYRVVNDKITSPLRLGLPKDVMDLASLKAGLVILAAPSSEGKTTVTGALIEWLNQNRNYHVLYAALPAEHGFASRRSLIHTADLSGNDPVKVLRNALFADFDAVFFDAPLTKESLEAVFPLCDAGKLCVLTVSAKSAADAISHIINMYSGKERNRVKEQFCAHIKAIYAQRKITAQEGTFVAYECLKPSPKVYEAIAEEDLKMIDEVLSEEETMRSLDESLAKLVRDHALTKAEAAAYIKDEERFSKYLIEGK
ncbi:MAG: hypothetical protein IIY44_01510 [Erysipelotrichales bacterium]|nr:hypothetical protein [Erysipelotrichales bacterium]